TKIITGPNSGPNQIRVGADGLLYVADYYENTVRTYNLSNPGTGTAFYTGAAGGHISGIAFASGSGIGQSGVEPAFFSELPLDTAAVPEPGTWVLFLGASLVFAVIRYSRKSLLRT